MLRASIYLTMEDDAASEAIWQLLVELEDDAGCLSASTGPLLRLANDRVSVDDMVHLKSVFPVLAERAATEAPDAMAPFIREAASQVARVMGKGEITLSRTSINILEKFGMKMKNNGDDDE